MTIDKEQLAKIRKSASFRPREGASCQLLRIYGVVIWHYSFTSEEQQEAIKYLRTQYYTTLVRTTDRYYSNHM